MAEFTARHGHSAVFGDTGSMADFRLSMYAAGMVSKRTALSFVNLDVS
jgi:hypothetical protein